MTQSVLFSKIIKDRLLRSYCKNLIWKINYKNDGINFEINLDMILKMEKFPQDSFMFFGADVLHPTNVTHQHPSIAGKLLIIKE